MDVGDDTSRPVNTNKAGRLPIRVDVLLSAVAVAVVLIARHEESVVVHPWENLLGRSCYLLVTFLVIELVLFSCLVVKIPWLGLRHNATERIPRLGWRNGLLQVFLLVLPIVTLYCIITFGRPGAAIFLQGFQTWAKAHVDIEKVRAWKATLKPDSEQDIPRAKWPKFVQEWRPSYVMYRDAQWLEIWWGGGFGHWGLNVGSPAEPMPPPPRPGFHLPLADGAYVWHEDQ